MSDIRDAWRSLCATPIVSIVVVLSLALGIGANTAIFSLVNAVTLKPVPGREPGSLYHLSTSQNRTGIFISVRSAGESPGALVPRLTEAIGRLDRNATLTFRTLADQVSAQYTQERIIAILSGFFGGLALLLAALGLYGVTAFSVSRRRQEIGIRVALGATPAAVVGLVLSRVATLVGLGVALGFLLSYWAAQFVTSLLFNVEPRDPATLTFAILVLLAVSGLAAAWPARRAGRVDPAMLLKDS